MQYLRARIRRSFSWGEGIYFLYLYFVNRFVFFMGDSRSPTPPLYICAKCSMQQAETLFVSGAMLGIEYSSFKITHTWQTFVSRMNYVNAASILSWWIYWLVFVIYYISPN